MDILDSLRRALADRYDISRELGRGGMATVFLAEDLKHQRQVAIKVLQPELAAVLGAERFLSEIRVTANLQHPNLLPLFDSGEAAGLLFYVMPFVEGETLRARLAREGQLPVDEAVRLTRTLAGALDYAHQRGVIHRDLKPENILLQAGQPMIADFGIALAVSNAGGQRVTQTGLSLGTPQYMSPEQATGDRQLDGRTDLYALAAMAHEMLTGEPPHVGHSAQAIMAKLMTEQVRPLTTLRKSVPLAVDVAVRRALEKLPADRYPTAGAFAAALGDGLGPADRYLVPPGAWRGRLNRSMAAALVLTTSVAAWGLWQARSFTSGAAGDAAAPFERRLLSFDVVLPDSIGAIQSARPIGAAADQLLITAQDGRYWLYSLADRSLGRINVGSGAFDTEAVSPDGAWLLGARAAVRGTNDYVFTLVPLGAGLARPLPDTAAWATWQDDTTVVLSQRRAGGFVIVRRGIGTGAAEPESLTTIPYRRGADTVTFVFLVGIPRTTALLLEVSAHPVGKPAERRRDLVSLDLAARREVPISGTLPARHSVLSVLPNGFLLTRASGDDSTVYAAPFAWRTGTLGTSIPVSTVRRAAIANGTLVSVPSQSLVLAAVNRRATAHLLPGADIGDNPHSPQVAPDGRTLAFAVLERGAEWTKHIYTYRLPGGPPFRIASFRDGRNPSLPTIRWGVAGDAIYTFQTPCNCVLRTTRDGSRTDTVALKATRDGIEWFEVIRGGADGDLLVVSDSGGLRLVDPRRDSVVARPRLRGRVSNFAISPDGKWLAYRDIGSDSGLFVAPLSGGSERWRIPKDGADFPTWSRGGSELFFKTRDSVVAASLDFTPNPAVREVTPLFRTPPFAILGFGVLLRDTALVVPVFAGRRPLATVVVNFGDEVARLLGRR